MATLETIKQYSYQANKTVWEIEIASKVIPNSRILSITDLEQQLDYPNLNEFTVGTVTIELSDPEGELSPHNPDNYFVMNDRLQTGYRTPITVKAGFEIDGTSELVALFIGEITQIEGDEIGATVTIQAIDRTQELRNKNIVNFGLTKTFSLEAKESRTHGNYPVANALKEVSQHSTNRMFAAAENPKKNPERTFILYPGVGTPPYVGPRSPYLYEQEQLQTEGDLENSKFFEVTSDAYKIERGELDTDLTVTCKVPFRYRRVSDIVKEILNHTYRPDASIVDDEKFEHQDFHYDPDPEALIKPEVGTVSLTDKFKGALASSPAQPITDDFYYNTDVGAFYLYDGGIWFTDEDYTNTPQMENNFTVIKRRQRVDARLNALGFNIVRELDTDDRPGKLWNLLDQEELLTAKIINPGESALLAYHQLEFDYPLPFKDPDDDNVNNEKKYRTTTITDKFVNIYDRHPSTDRYKFAAAIPKIQDARAFEIKDTQIDIPPTLLDEDSGHFASRGRIGYEIEHALYENVSTRWHWTGYVTDFTYEKPNSEHGGRFYFLYTIPLNILTELNDKDYPDEQIKSKLIQYNVDDDTYQVLYAWGDKLFNPKHEHGEFWALAHNEDYTEFFILATRSETFGNTSTRANYDSLEINESEVGKVVILKVFKDTDSDKYISRDFVTSKTAVLGETDRYSKYRPQLAHFYGFSVLGGSQTPSFEARIRGLPDNRRAFFVKKHGTTEYLYYPFVQHRSQVGADNPADAADRFGYARIDINTVVGLALPVTATQSVIVVYSDDRYNRMGFDMVFDSRDDSVFYFGYVDQVGSKEDVTDTSGTKRPVRPKTSLKILKVTIT